MTEEKVVEIRAILLELGEAMPKPGRECWVHPAAWNEAAILVAMNAAGLISVADIADGVVSIRGGVATINFTDGAPSSFVLVREECLRPIE